MHIVVYEHMPSCLVQQSAAFYEHPGKLRKATSRRFTNTPFRLCRFSVLVATDVGRSSVRA